SRNAGSTWQTLASNVQNTSGTGGSFAWTVTTPATSQGKVRVTWTTNPNVTDTSSGNFDIIAPTVTVVSPNGGGTWTAGTSQNVTWSNNVGNTGNVRIELSTNGGATFPIVLIASTPNDGTQAFTVQSAWATT